MAVELRCQPSELSNSPNLADSWLFDQKSLTRFGQALYFTMSLTNLTRFESQMATNEIASPMTRGRACAGKKPMSDPFRFMVP
jgi:hypothetical protein